MKHTIYTHSNIFHIDELMAIALLKRFSFKKNDEVEIIRTREQTILNEVKQNKDIWVIDVGFEYNADMLNFDHHQSEDLTWNDKDRTPFSSCGLIWKWLKDNKKIHYNEDYIQEIEENIIKLVDMQDNGIKIWKESQPFFYYNRKNPLTDDVQFEKALSAIGEFLDNLLFEIKSNMGAKKAVKISVKQSKNKKDVVFFKGNFNNGAYFAQFMTDKRFVCYPRSKGYWIIQAIPYDPENPYSHRALFPELWRGKENEELHKISGLENLVFCHNNGFLLVFKGEQEFALDILNKISLDNV